MFIKRFVLGSSLVSCGLFGGWSGATVDSSELQDLRARAALQELHAAFHEATTTGAHDLMFSLWAEDAVFSNPAGTFVGPAEITGFFAGTRGWGRQASVAPAYKTHFDVDGDTATFEYECILVDGGGGDPLTTPMSTLPPGSQNPAVEIVAHLHAIGTAVKRPNGWVFHTYSGGAGPLQ
ncbi:MAG: nuclear transport factor 2 family protein [Planctomycetota bacterium]